MQDLFKTPLLPLNPSGSAAIYTVAGDGIFKSKKVEFSSDSDQPDRPVREAAGTDRRDR